MGVRASAARSLLRWSVQSAALAGSSFASVSSSEAAGFKGPSAAASSLAAAAARRGRPRTASLTIRKSAVKPKSPTPVMRASTGSEPHRPIQERVRKKSVSVASAAPRRSRRSVSMACAERRSAASSVSAPSGRGASFSGRSCIYAPRTVCRPDGGSRPIIQFLSLARSYKRKAHWRCQTSAAMTGPRRA